MNRHALVASILFTLGAAACGDDPSGPDLTLPGAAIVSGDFASTGVLSAVLMDSLVVAPDAKSPDTIAAPGSVRSGPLGSSPHAAAPRENRIEATRA